MDDTNSTLDYKLKALSIDVSEIKTSLTALTQAITKMALIEERQSASNVALDRAFTSISDLYTKVQAIELSLPALKAQTNQSAIWVDRIVWVVVSGSLVYMMKAAGYV